MKTRNFWRETSDKFQRHQISSREEFAKLHSVCKERCSSKRALNLMIAFDKDNVRNTSERNQYKAIKHLHIFRSEGEEAATKAWIAFVGLDIY